jgi:pimeloyl-ACP methyl ester carboxylesterase
VSFTGKGELVVGEETRGMGKRAGLLGAAVGVVATGAAMGIALERFTIGRSVRQMARAHDPGEAFGTIRGRPQTVLAADGVELYLEIDEPGDWPRAVGSRPDSRAEQRGDLRADLRGDARADSHRGAGTRPDWYRAHNVPSRPTVGSAVSSSVNSSETGVGAKGAKSRSAARRAEAEAEARQRPTLLFTHGFCLSQDVWHYQRAAFANEYRMVFWDQRGHGRSDPPKPGGELSIDVLGEDLYAVLEAACPTGPVILIGHSMGGMTMMALAAAHPELFAGPGRSGRIVGAALIGTSAGRFQQVSFGLPKNGAKLLHRTVPALFELLAKQNSLVDRGRRATGDLSLVLTKRYAFGSDVSESVVRFALEMIHSTSIEMIAQFFPIFDVHDKSAALAVFDDIPALVLVGGNDQMLPMEHSRVLADAMPGADFVVVPNGGHLVILEHPREVEDALRTLVDRVGHRLAANPAESERPDRDRKAAQ